MKIKKYNEFIEVPNSVKDLSDIFKLNNKKLFIVGGYLRDKLMGLDPLDIDLCTDSLPDDTIEFLKGRYKIDFVGKAFGVIIVHLGEMKIEIASFRKDLEDKSGGRHPEVKLGVTIEDDVKRRDITISSLFYDIQDDKIVDLVGGISDIQNKIVRMVGDPKLRLEEDQLRALRVLRFSTRYEFTIDPKTKSALKSFTDLSKISSERVWEEFIKAFKQSKNFNDYLNYITDLDMWPKVFPKSDINTELVKSNDLIIIVANLFKNENTNGLLSKLVYNYKIEIDTANKVIFLLDFLNLNENNAFDLYKRKIQCLIKDSTIMEWIKSNSISDKNAIKFLNYRPSISAQELMDRGIKGKELGLKIKELETQKFRELI